MYYASLQSPQAPALEEARRDFEDWKAFILTPDFQAKEAAARETAAAEFAAFKHTLTIEVEERKENARLQAVKDATPPSKAELRLSRRKERKADPMKGSRSVSRAASPTSSVSSRKATLDKTPTKADFQVSQVVLSQPLSGPLPLYGPEIAKASAGPSSVPGDLRTPPFAADTLQRSPPDALMDGTAGQVDPVRPPQVTAVPPVSAEVAQPTNIPAPNKEVALVEHYQWATPSITPPTEDTETRMLRMLQQVVCQAVQPIQTPISDLHARIANVEKAQVTMDTWGPGAADPSNIPPIGADYQQDYLLNRREDTDEDMSEPEHADEEQCNVIHPFFYRAYALLMDTPLEKEYDITEAQQLGVADMADSWYSFCVDHRLPDVLPPAQKVANAFVEFSRIDFRARAYKEKLLRSIDNDIIGPSVAPEERIPAFREPAKELVPGPHPKYVQYSDDDVSTQRHQSAPPITSFGDPASAPIELSSSDEAPVPMRDTDARDTRSGWSVVGGKKGKSFADIVATKTPLKPATLLPIAAQAAGGFITKAQLEGMTKEQIVHSYNLRFEPHISAGAEPRPASSPPLWTRPRGPP